MSEPRPRIDASRAHGALLVEHCDVPVGMTLCEWRRSQSAPRSKTRRRSWVKRVFTRAA